MLSYLGHNPIFNWITANTALSNTGGMRQYVHKDNGFPHPQYPYYFVANIPLCEFGVENGATEFWLGSHAHTSSRDQLIAESTEQLYTSGYRIGQPLPQVTDQALEERRSVSAPIQPESSPGDVVIRDIRLWHAGMPNNTDQNRIMLGLGYQVSQWQIGLLLRWCVELILFLESLLPHELSEMSSPSFSKGFLHQKCHRCTTRRRFPR